MTTLTTFVIDFVRKKLAMSKISLNFAAAKHRGTLDHPL